MIILGVLGIALSSVVLLAYDRHMLIKDRGRLLEEWGRFEKRAIAFQGLAGFDVVESIHVHVDWRLFVNGKPIDYYTEEHFESNAITHMHSPEDGPDNDWVIHAHNKGVTLRHFLTGLGIEASHRCLELDGNRYCNSDDLILTYYINGELNVDAPDYELQDGDRILVTFGNETGDALQSQLNMVGSIACIKSAKC